MTARAGLLLAMAFAQSCGATTESALEASPSPSRVRYEARIDDALETMWVRACFDGLPPARMVPMTTVASDVLVDAFGPVGQPLTPNPALETSEMPPGTCLRYEVDLQRASWISRFARRQGGDLLISQTLFLWRPEPMPEEIEVRFEGPPDLFVSAPWPRLEEDVFALDASALRIVGNVAFLRRPPKQLEVEGVAVEIARLDGPLAVGPEGVERWVREAVRAVAQLDGGFPRERLHVVVVPIGPGYRPVAFGLVRRGGGASVMLLVHENTTLDALVSDWTAVHEFSHLFMPRMFQEDRWISEGLATYYQEVLRARAGLITPLEAWQHIDGAFRRGEGRRGRSLWQESERMRAFHRIYWGGTAFALEADLALRLRGTSLDVVVSEGQRLWGEGGPGRDRTWHGRQCMRRFDEMLGEGEVLESLMDEHGRRRSFPDMDALLRDLGLRRDAGGELHLVDGRFSHIRDAIMSPHEPGTRETAE